MALDDTGEAQARDDVADHLRELLNRVAATEQPAPTPNDRPSCHDLVVEDVVARKALGLARYGSLLQVGNDRDPLRDAYEEALDLVAYLRQLRGALDEVVALLGEVAGWHARTTRTAVPWPGSGPWSAAWCVRCDVEYPCRTGGNVRQALALLGARGGDGEPGTGGEPAS